MTIDSNGRKVNVTPGKQGFQETSKDAPTEDTIAEMGEPFDVSAYAGVSRQSPTPLEHLSLQSFNRQARETVNHAREGHIDLNPPYQRPSVWTLDQKINLVKSWLTGVAIPSVILNDRGSAAWRDKDSHPYENTSAPLYAVVDGKQRIEAAADWFEGRLAVPASWFEPELVDTTVETDDGPYITYDRLTTVGQRLIGHKCFLPISEARLPSVEDEAELYLRLNTGGTAHTNADLDKARALTKEKN